MRDTQDKETSVDEIQTDYKRIKTNPQWGDIFNAPKTAQGPTLLIYNV